MKQRKNKRHNPVQYRNNVGRMEALEPRLLMYSAAGGVWPKPELLTVSFMPDGTDIGGTPSGLFAKMNSVTTQATWQLEILKGLQDWAAASNVNFAVVSDDGSPWGSCGGSGTDCNIQGDANFGDIRIGALNLGTSLGIGLMPPSVNQDTTAGDFFFNTTTAWKVGATYDIHTMAAHEAGHGIGVGHSTTSSAIMYATYNTVKSALASDDKSGGQALYSGVRKNDAFDTTASNGGTSSATVITSYIDSNKQINLTGLDITTTSDIDYLKFTVPSGAASSMTIKMQSTGFSLLAPKLMLYNSSGKLISGKSVTGAYHSTVTLTQPISAGQVYYIVTDGADSTVFGTGKYGIQVNMGTAALPTLSKPITTTAVSGSGGTSMSYSSEETCGAGLPPGLAKKVCDGTASYYSTEPHSHGDVDLGHATVETIDASHGSHASDDSFEVERPRGRKSRHVDVAMFARSVMPAQNTTLPAADSYDDVWELDPVDVVRPKFDLVCDLAGRFT
jgi:hypothetical protein